MTCYFVFTKLSTCDQSKLEAYREQAAAILREHPQAKPLVAYGDQTIMEGPTHEGMVILSFPDRETALRWYNSADYRKARELRLQGGRYQATLVDGLD